MDLKSAILEEILALRDRFPHLRAMDRSHLRPEGLAYENGRTTIPNPRYRREAREGRKVPAPSRTISVLRSEDGIVLSVRFVDGPTMGRRTAVSFPVPGYESIGLRSTGTEYEARVGPVWVEVRIEGGNEEVREAVFGVLKSHAST